MPNVLELEPCAIVEVLHLTERVGIASSADIDPPAGSPDPGS